MGGKSGWKFLDTVLVRSAGFPFSLISQFRFKKTWAGFEEMGKISDEIERSAGEIVKEIRQITSAPENAQLRTKLNKARNDVDKRREIPADHIPPESKSLLPLVEKWNGAVARLAKTSEKNRATFESELSEMRGKLRDLVKNNATFREAMFMSSVGSSENMVTSYLASAPETRDSETKRRERFFTSYLQRFCTKNDTHSFFGPMNYGKAAPENKENFQIQLKHGNNGKKIAETEVFLSHWAYQELAAALSRLTTVRPHVTPHLTPFYLFSNDRLYHFGLVERELDPKQLTVLREIDGNRSFKEIHGRLSGMSGEEFWRICDDLAQEKVISDSFLVSPYSDNGIPILLNFISTLPAAPEIQQWKEQLTSLEEQRVKFKSANYPERTELLVKAEKIFETLTGRKARREEGKFYGDRSIFSEESHGVVERLELGGELLERLLSSLGKILDVLGLLAVARWECWQHVAGQMVGALSNGSRRVTFNEFWNEFEEEFNRIRQTPEFKAYEHAIEKAMHTFEESVGADGVIDHKRLAEELPKILGGAGLLKRKSYPLSASADILVGSKSIDDMKKGICNFYIGAIHYHLHAVAAGSFLYFCPWKTEHFSQLHSALESLAKPHKPLHIAFLRRHKLYPSKIEGFTFYPQQLGAAEPNVNQVLLYDLDVIEKDGEIVLEHRKSGQTFRFTFNYLQDRNLKNRLAALPEYSKHLLTFFFPHVEEMEVPSKEITPRTVWNGLAYERAHWDLSEEVLKELVSSSSSGYDLFWNAYRVMRGNNLPSCSFARHPQERKPFFVDLQNFFLVEMLQHVLRSEPKVTLSEMAPNENELWLEIDGERHSCEFRFGIYNEGYTVDSAAAAEGNRQEVKTR